MLFGEADTDEVLLGFELPGDGDPCLLPGADGTTAGLHEGAAEEVHRDDEQSKVSVGHPSASGGHHPGPSPPAPDFARTTWAIVSRLARTSRRAPGLPYSGGTT